MACNWLMMTSSGDDNRPSGSLGLLTDKTEKKKKTAARFNYLHLKALSVKLFRFHVTDVFREGRGTHNVQFSTES